MIELLDNPLPYTTSNYQSSKSQLHHFIVDDIEYEVEMVLIQSSHATYELKELLNKVLKDPKDFYDILDEGGELIFSSITAMGNRWDITGSGNAVQVFSTIVDIFKNEIQQNFQLITFSAKEKSRVKLYDLFASKLQQIAPNFIYVGNCIDGWGDQVYVLINKKWLK